jgi:hypothetical protein|tara:strand:+ start:52 stop:243 length:192 start_codon:yes stop_codon:yes gene_type:complete
MESIIGKRIILKPEWLEDGEENIVMIAITDIEKGRLDIESDVAGFNLIKPTQTINASWIKEII